MANPVIDAYLKHVQEREEQGIPPRQLDPEQTRGGRGEAPPEPPKGEEAFLLASCATASPRASTPPPR